MKKVIELVHDYDIPEGFVCNYNKKIWMKYALPKAKF